MQELKRCKKSSLAKLAEVQREQTYYQFPQTRENCKTVLTLKRLKTESSIRRVYVPQTVARKLKAHKEAQEKHKKELSGLYQDYNLVIAEETGRPKETRRIDAALKKFVETNNVPKVVFHSHRHLSTSEKLKVSSGDVKAVQGDTGHAEARMVTDVYAEIFDADRKKLAKDFDKSFFETETKNASNDDHLDAEILKRLRESPELRGLLMSLLSKT